MNRMPDSPTLWIIAVCALALVVGLMIWRGVGGRFKFGSFNFAINDARKPNSKIEVATELDAEDSKIGNITGVESGKSGQAPATSDVVVGAKARIVNSEVGDITGVKVVGPLRGKKE